MIKTLRRDAIGTFASNEEFLAQRRRDAKEDRFFAYEKIYQFQKTLRLGDFAREISETTYISLQQASALRACHSFDRRNEEFLAQRRRDAKEDRVFVYEETYLLLKTLRLGDFARKIS